MKRDAYTRLHLWLVAHRRWVLLAMLVITAVCVVLSTRIHLEQDALAVLPKNDLRVDEFRYATRKFRQIERVFVDVGINRDDPDQLAHAADELFAALSKTTNFARILYRIDAGASGKSLDIFTGALPNLFTADDARELEKKLDPNSVREYLTAMRRKLTGPEGMVLKEIVAADPIGSSALLLPKFLPLQAGFGDAQTVDGRITSGDERHVLMILEPFSKSSDYATGKVLIEELLRTARGIEKEIPGIQVAITGGHRMTVDNNRIILADALRCIIIGTMGMLVLFLVAYRRRWLALVTFLPSLFSTLIAGVVVAFFWQHLTALAMGFATIALGVTVDYAIHIIYHLDDAAGTDRESIGHHLSRLVFPVALGAITTIAAFLVMMQSPMEGFRQLGFFGAVGVVFSVGFSLFILPLMVPIAKKTGQPPLWLTRWLGGFFAWQRRHRLWLVLFVLTMTAATVFGVRKLRFEGDITKLNGITQSTRKDDKLINEVWGTALGMTVVIAQGKTPEEALAQNDRVAEKLATIANVTNLYSLSTVCPSPITQESNLRRWHEFWTTERREGLQRTLAQAGGDLGFRTNAFDRFWQIVETTPKLLTLDTFRGTPLEQALAERIAFSPGDNAVSTIIKVKDRSKIAELREALAGALVIDPQDFASHMAKIARGGLGQFALWTALLVGGMVLFSLGSIELLIAVLLPLAFGLLWTFGLMGWMGFPIDLMNSVFVIFIIGVGEDYSVFLTTSRLDEWRGQLPMTAANTASVLVSALTTIFGFGVMVLADHPALFTLGATVLLGMACAFAATVILTPLVMDLLLFRDPPIGAPRFWHPLGTLWVLIHLGGGQLVLYYVLRPILKIVSWRRADDRLRRATRWAARGVVKGMPFGKLEFRNISPETFSRPCVVISNHQSAVDVMLVVSLPGDVRQTAKKRVFDAPMLGFGCKILGHVMVEPNDPEVTLQRCRDRLNEGACVHFYPEGTRSFDGFIQRFRRGAFELAIELNQEILPIIICDSNTAMPRDSYWFERFHTVVKALPRVTPQTFDYSQGVAPLMKHCENVVRTALQVQLDEINTPAVVRRKVARLYRYQGTSVEQFAYWKMQLDSLFPALDSVVPRQGFILDLGCGYGLATHWLAAFTDERTFLGVDYDEDKIRVARRTAPDHPRMRFEPGDILEYEFPTCDVVLLLDVLHYWQPEKQQIILTKARQALRLGGQLVLRDGVRAETEAHRKVHRWELFATWIGHNRTKEGLHFLSFAEMEAMLHKAGFSRWELKPEAKQDSNVLLVAHA